MLDALYHSLDPIAFSVGPFDVRWYGLAYIFGIIMVGLLMYRISRRWGMPLSIDDILTISIAEALGVIIGARLFYVLFYNLEYYLQNPLHIFMFTEGGMSFHGGLVGVIVAGLIVCKILKISFATIADIAAIAAPIGLFLGRCANFINGELWGKPTDLPWGVSFESGGGIMRHPSQLYEAFLEGVVIFVVLFVLSRKIPARPQGTFLGTFLLMYGVFRFLVEFVRVPDAQLGYLWGPITMGQLLSLPLVIAGIVLLIVSQRLKRPQRMHLEASADES